MKKIIILFTVLVVVNGLVFSSDFGADGALKNNKLSLESMLLYALQDEYLALTEYETLVKNLGVSKPFTNIIGSEKTHIQKLEELYKSYNIKIPKVDTKPYLYIPKTSSEAGKVGVEAEIKNIAMYEKFLKEKLNDDVRAVFEFLKSASENHLAAFKRLSTNTIGNGSGSGKGRS